MSKGKVDSLNELNYKGSAQQPQRDWRKETLSAKRGVIVCLKNDSQLTLTRTKTNIIHGEWRKLPPETILPKTTAEWASSSKPLSLHGTEAEIIYTNHNNEQFIFKHHLPQVGSKSKSAAVPSNCKIVTTESSTSNLKTTQYNIVHILTSEVIPSPPSLSDSHFIVVQNKMTRLSRQEIVELESSFRSLRVIINNTTSKSWKLNDSSASSGKWKVIPADVVGAVSEHEFALVCDPVSHKVSGKVVYDMMETSERNKAEQLELSFGTSLTNEDFRYRLINDSFRFRVQVNVNKGAHASVTFFIEERAKQGVFGGKLETSKKYDFFKHLLDYLQEDVVSLRATNWTELPSLHQVLELQQLIENGMEINYKDYDRMSIIQIVKIFLKELDEAVLPPTYLSSKTNRESMKKLIASLPVQNKKILMHLLRFINAHAYDPIEGKSLWELNAVVNILQVEDGKIKTASIVFAQLLCAASSDSVDNYRQAVSCVALLCAEFEFIFEEKIRTEQEEAAALEQTASVLKQELQQLTEEMKKQGKSELKEKIDALTSHIQMAESKAAKLRKRTGAFQK